MKTHSKDDRPGAVIFRLWEAARILGYTAGIHSSKKASSGSRYLYLNRLKRDAAVIRVSDHSAPPGTCDLELIVRYKGEGEDAYQRGIDWMMQRCVACL